MSTPWSPTEPIKNLFIQINLGVQFAIAGGQALPEGMIVSIAYDLIHNTGVFELPCRDWRALPPATQTWPYALLQNIFRKANNNRAATTSSAGFKSANSVVETCEASIAKLRKDFKLLIAAQNNANKQT